MQDTNPLLKRENTHRLKAIPFHLFKTEHFLPAIKASLEEAKAEVEAIRNNPEPPTFENTILALDMSGELLGHVSRIYFNLHSAESGPELKALAQEISPLLSQFSSSISTDPKIFERVQAVYKAEVEGKPKPAIPEDLKDKEALKAAERYRLIERNYKSFIRGGALLDDEDKKRYTEISMELSKLSPQFSNHVLQAINKFELHVTDPKDVEGMPATALAHAAHTAKLKGKEGGWLFTLQPASFVPLLTYCRNRELREKIHRANGSKAFNDEFDNQDIIKQTLKLRKEKAALLGFDTHADYVISERMAESKENVQEFLDRIHKIAMPAALKEVEQVQDFARELDGLDELMPWDFGYYSNKLKEKLYDFDPEELRPWFKVENVLEGLFIVAEHIYGIKVKQVDDVPTYHPDVTTWEVHDRDGSYLGLMYMDLFPRDTKRGGAWMTSFQSQGLHSDGLRRPMVSIVASLTPSTPEQPSLLRIDEVRTIFHEFGHALHGLLADGYYSGLSGTGVLWDFVELPSQIMENWLYEKEALDLFARHYETGEPLPQELLEKMIAAKNFQSGVANVTQVRYANLDLAWHTTDPESIQDINKFEDAAIEPYRFLPIVDGYNMSCSFGHIFAGGYSAGYYSYKWAEALEADAWSIFKEKGIFDPDTANSFRENILARGNAFHPMDLFVAFAGRKPDPDALLKRDGLI
ncbi:MAG TPA: M3 family metallopeptidase [Candidatus Cloacimonetes bacterium]|nr:M3 family metallopeptidase [Candidatus Cloacimonadota bacterium]